MTLDDTTPPPAPTDVLLGRVIIALGVIGCLCVVGVIVLGLYDKPVPDALAVALGGSVTGLAGVLVGRRA